MIIPQQPPQKEKGPYSSIFDWDALEDQEKDRIEKKKAAEQKIMRTNAVGDAFRLLIDAVGGSHDATIDRREPNPYMQMAADRYRKLDAEGLERMDRIRQQNYGAKMKDLEYQMQQDQLKTTREREDDLINKKRQWELEDQEKQWQRQTERDKSQFEQNKELKTLDINNQKAQERFRTDENIRQAKEIDALRLKSTINRGDRSKPVYKDDIPFQIPGTTKKIYLGKEEVQEMAYRLIEDKEAAGEYISDPVLRAIKRNEAVKPDAIINVIKDNWDYVKFAIPEFEDSPQTAPTPEQRMAQRYQQERADIENNPELRPKQRIRELNKLDLKYKDLISTQQKPQGSPIQLNQNDISSIDRIIGFAGWSKEQKRNGIYKYLTGAGYDADQAKALAEFYYSQY